MPKVTVIIPTYNRANYLPEAVNSVLEQTFTDFELLIVDDGSIDETSHFVAQLKDPRVGYIKKKHAGISHTMNVGVKASTGEFIARLDSDDIWLPYMLQSLVPILDSNPRVGLVYARAQGMDKDGNPIAADQRGKPLTCSQSSFLSMLMEDHICNIALVVRRECFDFCGYFNESMKMSEDWEMYLRIAKYYSFIYHDLIVAKFRYHGSNITGRGPDLFQELFNERISILDRAYSTKNANTEMMTVKRIAYFNIHFWAGKVWLNQGEYGDAIRAFRKAIKFSSNPANTAFKCTRYIIKRKIIQFFKSLLQNDV